MTGEAQQFANLTRMVHGSLLFGRISLVENDKATAKINTASGDFETPLLPVLNRVTPMAGDECLLIAPQGKPEQGGLLCWGVDQRLLQRLVRIEQTLMLLEQRQVS